MLYEKISSLWILTTNLWSKDYFCVPFTAGNAEAQRDHLVKVIMADECRAGIQIWAVQLQRLLAWKGRDKTWLKGCKIEQHLLQNRDTRQRSPSVLLLTLAIGCCWSINERTGKGAALWWRKWGSRGRNSVVEQEIWKVMWPRRLSEWLWHKV